MQYPPETSSEVNEQSAAVNANWQHETVLNAEAAPYRSQQRYPYRRMLLGSLKPTCPGGASLEEGGTNRAYRKADTRVEPAHSNTLRT